MLQPAALLSLLGQGVVVGPGLLRSPAVIFERALEWMLPPDPRPVLVVVIVLAEPGFVAANSSSATQPHRGHLGMGTLCFGVLPLWDDLPPPRLHLSVHGS